MESTYEIRKSWFGHDALFRKDNNVIVEYYELISELVLVFDYKSIKLFYLFNHWCRYCYPDAVLLDYWNKRTDILDKLPDYMTKSLGDLDYSELYQDFFLDTIDT